MRVPDLVECALWLTVSVLVYIAAAPRFAEAMVQFSQLQEKLIR